MSIGDRLEIHGLTDVGHARDHNEDSIRWEPDLGLVVLADGMGGHNAGEVASDMAVNSVIDELQDAFRIAPPEEIDEASVVAGTLNAVNTANQQIFQAAADCPGCSGMGTTLVVALFSRHTLTIAHVGDSRAYRLRQDRFDQLTTDHSLIQEMVQSGYVSEEEAAQSLNKNMITRALGVGAEVEIDIQQQELRAGDVYLLCSDGLTDLVSDADIKDVLDDCQADLAQASRRLVEVANHKGGSDNISVIIVRVGA